jgi:hypothetical protein
MRATDAVPPKDFIAESVERVFAPGVAIDARDTLFSGKHDPTGG